MVEKIAEMTRDTIAEDPDRWAFLLRLRYQVAFGGMIAIIAPAIIISLVFNVPLDLSANYNTVIGGFVALLLGNISYRKLQIFPGITSGGYIFTSFSIAFAALATALILLRLDFSRVQFLVSWVLTVSYFTYVHLRFIARREIVLGVIPGGATNRLPLVPRATWYRFSDPDELVPRLAGVVADLRADHSPAWNSRIASFVLNGTPVYHVKEAIEQLSGRVEVEHLSENTLGSLNPNDFYIKVKATIDGVIAFTALLMLAPALLLVAFLIRLDSPGPALFRQQRVGFRARPFTVYKFRTMMQPTLTGAADDSRSKAMTQPNDPRITRLGSFLRKTRIDELPQLINIIRGEMSLIGPRPEALPLSQWYEQEIPFYHYRHIIKPGVTGWAQVNQGHVTDVNDVREKLHLDFYYVKNFSFWLDILITLRTAQTIVTGHGAR